MACLILVLLWLDTALVLPVMSTMSFYPLSILQLKHHLLTSCWQIYWRWVFVHELPRTPLMYFIYMQKIPHLLVDCWYQMLAGAKRKQHSDQTSCLIQQWSPEGMTNSSLHHSQCPITLVQLMACGQGAHLADSAHCSHVALIPGAELWWCEQACRVEAV